MTLAFDPHGNSLYSGGGDTISTWNVSNSKKGKRTKGHALLLDSLVLSGSGKLLFSMASAYEDPAGIAKSEVLAWNVRPNGLKMLWRKAWSLPSTIGAISYAQDSQRLAIGGTTYHPGATTGRLELVDFENNKSEVWPVSLRSITSLAFSHNENVLAVAGESLSKDKKEYNIEIWEFPEMRPKFVLKGHKDVISTLVFSKDDRTLASAGKDKEIIVWELVNQKRRTTLSGHKHTVNCIAVSSDGMFLGSGSSDQTARLWDLLSPGDSVVLDRHDGEVWSIAFSSKGNSFATSGGGKSHNVCIWDTMTVSNALRSKRKQLKVSSSQEVVWNTLSSQDSRAAHEMLISLLNSPTSAVSLVRAKETELHRKLALAEAIAAIGNLDDDRFNTREKASLKLRHFGHHVLPLLKEHIKLAKSLEAARRIAGVVAEIERNELPCELLGGFRFVELLERLGTKEAIAILREWEGEAFALPISAEAKKALKRMRQ